ncbi:spindle assembly checkpoint component Mad1 [Gamsiella multidivaricata]|uniref:spindle assembly checkpoint component Mad1 n=1 Tax=Gamsiella multidivaricata TaxID=101098 RepID=UPI00221FA745|nr:spindle assembly checkpoint component Mad1 [Gamsiella multidivaricata]KAI7826982.1 spindle assembly checkpoint component Mad1 [Gamsiella multidivaricata]
MLPASLTFSLEYEQTRKKLKDTQYELSSTKTELERKIITLEQAARESEILKKKLMSRVDSLESDRRFLFEQEKSLNKKYQALEESSIEFKTSSNEIIKNLREENMDLKERLSQLRETSRATESELSHRVRTLTASLTHQQQTLAESQGTTQSQSSLAEEKHRQLTEALIRIGELEDQNRQLRINEQGLEDVVRVEKELKNQVAYIKQLEGINRQLTADCKHYKEMYRNVEVLKEEKTGLEQRLKMLESLRDKCGMLEVQKEVLLKEKDQWTAFLESSDITDFNSPYDLAKTIASLRAEKASLIEVKGEFEAALKYRDTQIKQLEAQIEKLKYTLVEQEEYCRKQAFIARQHERSKELALRQAESLREQLKSYDTEEAQLMGGSYDSQKTARIEQLEKLVQEYHQKLESAISSVSNEMQSEQPSAESVRSFELLRAMQEENAATFSQLNNEKQTLFDVKLQLEQEIQLLRKENASLDAKVLEHEMAIGAGAFNPAASRVLELKDSPASRHQAIRQHILDSLKEENSALLKAVAQLQHQLQYHAELQANDSDDQEVALQDEGLIPAASYNRLKADHERLQDELAENVKRSKRLKESWTLKADEFLDAVRSLLGYKVNFLDNGRVELISIYSPEDQQSLIFTSGLHDEGTMQLVGSGSQKYMEEHKETFEHWVNQLGSIPAFLSRITLDLVEQQAQEQLQQQEPQRVFQTPRYPRLDEDNTQNSDMMMDM